MLERRRRFDREFRDGAVQIVRETGKPVAQVARELGIHEGTLCNWCARDREQSGETGGGGLDADERAELVRLRAEAAELRMERDVRKRSVVGWVKEVTRWSRNAAATAASSAARRAAVAVGGASDGRAAHW